MHVAMGAITALCLVILLAPPASASTKRASRAAAAHPATASLDLYSWRARRRARIILELKLLELRKAHLDRVRQVIERTLPLDCLFKDAGGKP